MLSLHQLRCFLATYEHGSLTAAAEGSSATRSTGRLDVDVGGEQLNDWMLKACVNGPRRPQEHPALPMTAAELAHDVAAVAAVGVDAVHLHVKDSQGADTLDGAALAAVLTSVRAAPLGCRSVSRPERGRFRTLMPAWRRSGHGGSWRCYRTSRRSTGTRTVPTRLPPRC